MRPSRVLKKLRNGEVVNCFKVNLACARAVEIAALAGVSLLVEPALILGGLAGLWGLRRRWETLLPLPLFLLGTMGIHVIVVSQMRYRLPVMPILILGLASLLARPPQSAKR